jgi:hypothetical protein
VREQSLRKWIQHILLEKMTLPGKQELSQQLLDGIIALDLPSKLPKVPWALTKPVDFQGGKKSKSGDIRFRVDATRGDRDAYADDIMALIKKKAKLLGLDPASIIDAPEQRTFLGKFKLNPSPTVKFLVRPGGKSSSAELGDIYEGNITDLFDTILKMGGIPGDALHFEQAGAGHGSDVQISAMAGGKPLFKLEAKNSATPALGSTAFMYSVEKNKYVPKPNPELSPTMQKSWNDVIEDSAGSVLTPLNTSARQDIIEGVYKGLYPIWLKDVEKSPGFASLIPDEQKLVEMASQPNEIEQARNLASALNIDIDNLISSISDAPPRAQAEDWVFNKDGTNIVGPGGKGVLAPGVYAVVKEEFIKHVFPTGKKGKQLSNVMGPLDESEVAKYYTSKGDDFIQIASLGLYSLKDGWQSDVAPLFKESLRLSDKPLRLRLRTSNDTFRAENTTSGKWIVKSDVDLKSPERLTQSLSQETFDEDISVVAQILAGALGLDSDKLLDTLELSTTPISTLVSQHGSSTSTPTSWSSREENPSGDWQEEFQEHHRLQDLRLLIRESLLREELTKSDKKEIEKIARKQAKKEIDKVVGTSLEKTIQKEVEKILKNKTTKEELAQITKAVMKKLYKDLSVSYPQVIDRIKI